MSPVLMTATVLRAESSKRKGERPGKNAKARLLQVELVHFTASEREVTGRTPTLPCRQPRVYAVLAER